MPQYFVTSDTCPRCQHRLRVLNYESKGFWLVMQCTYCRDPKTGRPALFKGYRRGFTVRQE